MTKHWRKSASLPTGLHLHIPSADAPPQDLAFKVPETRIPGEPHNGAPEPHPALPAPPLAKGHTHTPWPGLRTEVMAQLASFSPWLSSALHVRLYRCQRLGEAVTSLGRCCVLGIALCARKPRGRESATALREMERTTM